MKTLYYVDKNAVLVEVALVDKGLHGKRDLYEDTGGIFYTLSADELTDSKLVALERQRDILAAEAKTELNNIFLANQRHQNLMTRLVELDYALYDIRKNGVPLTDYAVAL